MRSSVWIAVLLRDQGDLCWLCTCPMVPGDITIDHLHPKSHDGPDELSNLRLAHRACNVARGDLPVVETARALIGVRRIPSQVRRALREALMSWRDL